MPATYEPIATTTLGSAASTITFSSIPSTFTDLRIVMIGTAQSASFLAGLVRFNSDTGSNYSYTWMYGDGSAAGSGRASNQTTINLINWTSINSTTPGLLTFDVLSYAGSTNKTILGTGSNDQNGSGSVERVVGLWRSTSAINTITLSNAFGTGFTATLYGIKNF